MQGKDLFIRYFLEYAMLIPGTVAFLLPVRKFLRTDRRVVISISVALNAVFILGGSVFSCITGISTDLVIIFLLLIPLIVGLLIIDLQRMQTLFVFFNASALCIWSNVFTIHILAPIEAAYPDGPLQAGTGAFCLFVSCLLLLLFGNMLCERLPVMFQIPELDFLWKYIWLCPAVITVFLYWALPNQISNILVGRIYQVSLIVWIMMLTGTYFFYSFLWRFSEKLTREKYLIDEMRVLNAEKNRFSQMEGYVNELRSLRHDLRQHLRVLSAMLSSGQYEEMKHYLKKYVDTVKPEHSAFCANYAVDALAAYYEEYAEKMQVQIIWNLSLPPGLPIDETELCVIIGNLLENAIRASQKVETPDRTIEASVRMVGGNMIGIEIKNHYTGKIYLNQDGMPSSKDRAGIGLYSVSNTVRKNNGTLSVEVDDEWFCVDIIINIYTDSAEEDSPEPAGSGGIDETAG